MGLATLLATTCPRQPSPTLPSTDGPVTGRLTKTGRANASPEQRAELERLVFLLTNRIRGQRGITPLRGDAILAAVARDHSADMLEHRYFEHLSPDGTGPEQRIHRRHRTLIGTTGENLWSGTGYTFDNPRDVARAMVDGWMASRGHRRNLLQPNFTHLGVGIATADGGQIRATQNFAHTAAYMGHPIPAHMSPNDRLDLSDFELVDESLATPQRIAFDNGHKAAEPLPVGAVRVPALPGSYRLTFYFPQGRDSLLVFPGPTLEIRRP